jgi:hypothetical protein
MPGATGRDKPQWHGVKHSWGRPLVTRFGHERCYSITSSAADEPAEEIARAVAGLEVAGEEELRGVDALQLQNLEFIDPLPKAILFDEQWHEGVAFSVKFEESVVPFRAADFGCPVSKFSKIAA